MVGVAQSVELWIVAPAVAGSNPVAHPIFYYVLVMVSLTVKEFQCLFPPTDIVPTPNRYSILLT